MTGHLGHFIYDRVNGIIIDRFQDLCINGLEYVRVDLVACRLECVGHGMFEKIADIMSEEVTKGAVGAVTHVFFKVTGLNFPASKNMCAAFSEEISKQSLSVKSLAGAAGGYLFGRYIMGLNNSNAGMVGVAAGGATYFILAPEAPLLPLGMTPINPNGVPDRSAPDQDFGASPKIPYPSQGALGVRQFNFPLNL